MGEYVEYVFSLGQNESYQSLWSKFVSPIFYRILQTLLTSTPKTIHNIELKLDIISKINLRNGDSYDEYSKFIISEVLRLRDRGYTYPEIVSNLKDRGIRSRRNKEFYKNLLGSSNGWS